MLERDAARIDDGAVMDKILHATAAAVSMTIRDRVVHCDTTSNAITLTLPDVAEAEGKIFTIKLITDGGNNVTLQDRDESYQWSDLTFNDAGEAVCLYSDGHMWHVLANTIT